MSTESNSNPKFTDYPANPFEESHDHVNQWDVSVLWPDRKSQVRREETE